MHNGYSSSWLAQVGVKPLHRPGQIMIVYREWTAYHLTPRGWFAGDSQTKDRPLLRRPAPLDQVLSLVYKVTVDDQGYPHRFFVEVWRSSDHAHVVGLLARFGPAPAEL